MNDELKEQDSGDKNLDSIAISEEQFDCTAIYLKSLKRGLIEFLKNQACEHRLFPVAMDADSVQNFQGFRIQNNRGY